MTTAVLNTMSYTDKLIQYFTEQGDTFTIDDVKNHINDFKMEQDKLKQERADIVPVGKYKYKKVKDVANFDKQYLQWMLKQEWASKYPAFVEECKKYV